ncbi:MAG: hypothetical protein COW61_03730 [Candidatus Yonathbacteria bacterium CG17_big_fil_post_rev_8_21_14_2_50_46_19]|uniref:histidine kinase n=1 Tax=Candidatus Nomurabacteria bacterium CG1_02_47_685 TaxID=1805282 RepID=A0A1J4VE07_9BACT|nr:MAG: hypothetical protein AUJ44_01755 [Candidatus Nomurabacteria bacterium CG1_02_47_685]PIQ31393.1 MAG: hypothetical protein COW61_03730 [Candidatus Yonathbacteria bacterium CG17_big_fil_post_rev_8_21_14_2_50_46_19]
MFFMHVNLFETVTPASLVTLGSGVLVLVVGILIYVRDSSRKDTTMFLLITASAMVWSITAGLLQSISHSDIEEALIRLLYISGASMPMMSIFFADSLSVGKFRFNKLRSAGIIVLSLLMFSLIAFSDLIVWRRADVSHGWENEIARGPLFFLFVLYLIVVFTASLATLWRKYREAAGVFKIELRYIMIALAIAMFSIFIINLTLQIMGYYDVAWIGHMVAFLTATIIGYIMVKYNFWNIKLMTTELFIVLISLTLFTEVIFSRSVIDFVVKGTILALVVSSSFFLTRSVKRETESRQEVEKLAEELHNVNIRLQELNKKKSNFVEIAAHHLRDPLTAIRGYTSMLLEGSFGLLSANARGAVMKISESSKRLLVIIEEFMDISKIESGKIEYRFEKADLGNVLTDIIEEMKSSAESSGLLLTLEIVPKEDYRIAVDIGKIRQVISNLIDNALKYSLKGGIKVRMYKTRKKKILIIVSDTGIGMIQATIEKIFKKFSRAANASKFHTGGSGLGLYVAKEIIRNHDGRIWAESAGLGKGSTFYVELDPGIMHQATPVPTEEQSSEKGPTFSATG